MMKRNILVLVLASVVAVCAHAAAPNSSGTYYSAATGKKGAALKTAMSGIIYNHTEKSYDYLWTAFKTTDKRSDGKVWDMYSNITNFTFVTSGSSYSQEGDCYNREHSFPKSWFGGEVMPMYTDLHHMYPTDGFVNNKRANYPFGETTGNKYKSANDFSKLGNCTYPGYTGIVFEPADEYKGDFARTYFYMITCYEEKLPDWFNNSDAKPTIDGSTYPGFQIWQLNMLLKWAKDDPVSDKETARNTAVKNIQGNRNPFIDYPGLEQYIWGSCKDTEFSYDNYVQPTIWSTEYNSGGGGQGGGETPTGEEKTITLTYNSFGLTTTYAVYTATVDGYGFTVDQGYKGTNNVIQMNSSKGSGILYNTTAIPGLKSIAVNVSSGDKTYTITTGTSEKPTANIQTGTTTGTYNAADGDTYFQLKVSGASYFTSIVITYNDSGSGSTTIDPAFNNLADLSVDYGSTLTLTQGTTGTPNFVTDGTVTLTSSNSAVATVSGLTITPVAVGECFISVSTSATSTYNAGSTMFPITVNAPEGINTAYNPTGTTTTLDFNSNSWGLPTANTTGQNSYTSGGYTITLNASGSNNSYKYNNSINAYYLIMGKKGATLTLPAFDKAVTQIDVVGKGAASTYVTQNIYVGNTAVSTATTGATGTNIYAINSDYQAAGNIYTLKVTNSYNTQITSIVIHFAADASFATTLNGSGYATYCSQYPLDFSNATDYTAWQITDVSGSTISFSQITGAVKGGTGILLKGEANATVSIASTDSSNELDDNKLYGTLAPTYVDGGAYFGLSGENFVKVNAGTVPTGKALLPASVVDGSDVKALTFVFDGADGIVTVENGQWEMDNDQIFNLAGQRLQKAQRGINIINGKKVLVK